MQKCVRAILKTWPPYLFFLSLTLFGGLDFRPSFPNEHMVHFRSVFTSPPPRARARARCLTALALLLTHSILMDRYLALM